MLLPQGNQQGIGGGGVAAEIEIGAAVLPEGLVGGGAGGAVGGDGGFRLHGGLSGAYVCGRDFNGKRRRAGMLAVVFSFAFQAAATTTQLTPTPASKIC